MGPSLTVCDPYRIRGELEAEVSIIGNYTTAPGAGANAGVPATSWPRGKVLGGTSALNTLIWDRASIVEYDAWEKLGNKGWVRFFPETQVTACS